MEDFNLINRPFAVMADERNSVVKLGPTFKELLPKFLAYIEFDLKLAKRTAGKYEESLVWAQRHLAGVNGPAELCRDDIISLKRKIQERGAGASRTNSIIFALRKFLDFCNKVEKITTLDLSEVKPIKIPQRDVIIIPDDEIEQLMGSININTRIGMRMRALMEFLLGTGLRIFEALSLDRDEIDWNKQECLVIGKGNKQRKIYISDRAKKWVEAYLKTRKDDCTALFITFDKKPVRLKQFDLSKLFRRYVAKSGIRTHVTPHVFRHTAASIMLRNGCDIRYIQEILGHADIKTTVKYYIRVDEAAVKAAHRQFLKF